MTDADSTPPIRIAVIDPSDLGRACVAAVLENEAGFSVQSSVDVRGYNHDVSPDILLFQTAEASLAASEILSELKVAAGRWPNTPALVVADCSSEHQMMEAIVAGAHGLLPSTATIPIIKSAILLIATGIGIFPPELFARLRDDPVQQRSSSDHRDSTSFSLGELKSLTQRQQDVLHLLALGESNKRIAEQLRISESTVKVHLRAIMTQNGATNRTQIVAQYLKRNGRIDN